MDLPARQSSFKNVTLREYDKAGVESYMLLDECGEVQAFSMFIATLERRSSPNTVKAYARGLAHFFDYFYEAGCHIAAKESRCEVFRSELKEIIECWDDYLKIGEHSNLPLVQAVCTTLPSPYVGTSTSTQYHAALKKFLFLSERFRSEGDELSRYGFVQKIYDADVLYEDMGRWLVIHGPQRTEMLRTSMLSGVLAGGARKRKANILPLPSPDDDDEYDGRNLFPLDLFHDFLAQLHSYRDKALYCFYAASGCRSYEGLQLLWEDIDLKEQQVRLIDPKIRPNHPSYLCLTAQQRRNLFWKGRATSETFLIEPFASMFWENLHQYVRLEYVPHGQHQFVFQVRRASSRGAPYFTTAPTTRMDVFKAAHRKVGLPSSVRGPHSLRHAYATYILNYLPRPNGEFGLPIGIVRVVMGHKSIKSTEKYAVHDKDLIRAHLKFGNTSVFKNGSVPMSLNELKVQALLSKARSLGWTGEERHQGQYA